MNPLRRRQDAARRLSPMPCGCRDPLAHLGGQRLATYGLTAAERRVYARALWRAGWQGWEIAAAIHVEELAAA